MNANAKPVNGDGTGDPQTKKKRIAYLVGASMAAVAAIGGASTLIWMNSTPSRAARLAEKRMGPGARPDQAVRRPTGQPGGWGGPGGGGQRGQQMMDRMTAQFGLDASQQAQVKTLMEAQRPQMQAIFADKTMSPEDRRQKMRTVRQQMQAQMRALMTPDQQKKYDAWQSERQARRTEMQTRREQTREYLQSTGQKVPTFGGRRGGAGGPGGGRPGGGFGGGFGPGGF